MLSLKELWDAHQGRLIDKWEHYLPIYERHFAKFRGTAVRVLEIGVSHGGSLQLWKAYFGPKATIMGLDIDPRCIEYEEDQIMIYIGDQADGSMQHWYELDIVIDDGSHRFVDQQASLEALWLKLDRSKGVYLIEDCHEGKFPKLPPESGYFDSHYYPWVCVFERKFRPVRRIVTGKPSRPLNADERAAYGALNAQYLHTDL